jgi:hypothetical protein
MNVRQLLRTLHMCNYEIILLKLIKLLLIFYLSLPIQVKLVYGVISRL